MPYPASEKQINYLRSLIKQRVITVESPISTEQASVLLAVRDEEDDFFVSSKAAKELIDLLLTFEQKPRVYTDFPVSTRKDRLNALTEAKRLLAQYEAEHKAASEALPYGRGTWTINQCFHCGHPHDAGVHCRGSIQVMSDIWEQCLCTSDSPRATEEHKKVAGLARHVSLAETAVGDAERHLYEFRKGDRVKVVKGRKVRPGIKGVVLKTVEGQFGLRTMFITAPGAQPIWISTDNLVHDDEITEA